MPRPYDDAVIAIMTARTAIMAAADRDGWSRDEERMMRAFQEVANAMSWDAADHRRYAGLPIEPPTTA